MTTQYFWRRLLLPWLVLREQDSTIETLENKTRLQNLRLETAAERIKEQHHQLMYDVKTGAFSERGLHDQFEKLQLAAKQTGSVIQIGILAFDIDDFKPINDRWGHAAGDAVLRDIVSTVQGSFRFDPAIHLHPDSIARPGGDEFIILVPHCPDRVVEKRADIVRKLLDKFCVFEGNEISYSCSVGYTTFQTGERFDLALDLADKALYADKAKRQQIREGNVVPLNGKKQS